MTSSHDVSTKMLINTPSGFPKIPRHIACNIHRRKMRNQLRRMNTSVKPLSFNPKLFTLRGVLLFTIFALLMREATAVLIECPTDMDLFSNIGDYDHVMTWGKGDFINVEGQVRSTNSTGIWLHVVHVTEPCFNCNMNDDGEDLWTGEGPEPTGTFHHDDCDTCKNSRFFFIPPWGFVKEDPNLKLKDLLADVPVFEYDRANRGYKKVIQSLAQSPASDTHSRSSQDTRSDMSLTGNSESELTEENQEIMKAVWDKLNGQDEAVPPPAQRKNTPVIKSADTSANTSATGSGPSKVTPIRMPMGSKMSWFKNARALGKLYLAQQPKTHRRVLEALFDEITHQD